MNAVQAMNEVNGYLNSGDIASAQASVCAIEHERCTLPSSMFERVLRAAVQADALLPFFADFCSRAYGREQYASMVATLQAQRAA